MSPLFSAVDCPLQLEFIHLVATTNGQLLDWEVVSSTSVNTWKFYFATLNNRLFLTSKKRQRIIPNDN